MLRFLTALISCTLPTLALATNLYSNTMNADNGDVRGFSFRENVHLSGNSAGQLRITLQGSDTVAFVADHVAVCIAPAAQNNTCSAGAPCTGAINDTCWQEVLYSGAHGFSKGVGATVLSDWFNVSAAGLDVNVIVDLNASTASGDDTGPATGTGNNDFFHSATASYNVQAPAGYTNANLVRMVTLIETRSGPTTGGGQTMILMGTGQP